MKEKITKTEVALLIKLLVREIDKLYMAQASEENAQRLDDLFSLKNKLHKEFEQY